MSSDYQLGDTVYCPFTTRQFSDGVPTALVSGVVEIYEDAGTTAITAAETLTVSLNSVVGFNMVTVVATGANGFGTGQSYTLILSAGTVGGVSVIGEVVGHFTIEQSAARMEIGAAGAGLSDLGGMSTGMKAEVESEVNDSLKASGLVLHRATIETVTSQTAFVIPATDDAVDDDAYNGAVAVIIDGTDPNQISFRIVTDYTASSRTVTIDAAADFTVTSSDTLCILSGNKALRATTLGNTLDVTSGGAAGVDWGNVENKTTANDLSATDIQLCDTTTTNTDMVGTDSAALASSFTFTVAGQVDANIQRVNDVVVTGDGETGTEWGPA